MNQIVVSAPAKLILFGEHAVCYDKTAIAASLNLRTNLKICKNNSDQICIDFKDIKVHKQWSLKQVKRNLLDYNANLNTKEIDQEYLERIERFIKDSEVNVQTKNGHGNDNSGTGENYGLDPDLNNGCDPRSKVKNGQVKVDSQVETKNGHNDSNSINGHGKVSSGDSENCDLDPDSEVKNDQVKVNSQVQTMPGHNDSDSINGHEKVNSGPSENADLDLNNGCDYDLNRLQSDALKCFFYLYSSVFTSESAFGVTVRVTSSIPMGAGLGSSAALSVSLSAGLYALKNNNNNNDKNSINSLAFLAEKILHGNPSGIDNCTSVFGGMIAFNKRESFSQLCDYPQLTVVLVDSGVERRTKDMLKKVGEIPDLRRIVGEIGVLADKAKKMLENHSEESDLHENLSGLVRRNQDLLRTLSVSHAKLDEIVGICEQFGFEAKLTGAGGGGFAFMIVKPGFNIEAVLGALRAKGFKCWETKIGVNGVTIEKCCNNDVS